MLRTIFVVLVIAGFLPFALSSPFYALLFYLWTSYFRPEQWVWTDFVSALNLQLILGFWLVLITIASRQRFRFGLGPLLLLLFLLHTWLSAWLSPVPDWAWFRWVEIAKITLIGYFMVVLVTTEKRLRLTLGVIALSLAFEGAKQGWAQFFVNPGAANENRSPMLGDNNGVAIGMLMLLSLLAGLIRTSKTATERYVGRFLAVGVAYRALTTYSRGGFLAFAALILQFILNSKRKVASLIAVVGLGAITLPVLPDAFWDRMGTIQTAVENEGGVDRSSNARLHFWSVAMIMANDRPLVGVGPGAFSLVYNRYDPSSGEFGRGRAVHSAWFGLVAELGYPGLILFIVLFGRGLFICWRARRLTKAHPQQLGNIAIYATALEGALVVAGVGGTFFHCQYNEMLWHMFALTMVVDALVRQQAATSHVPFATPTVSPLASRPIPLKPPAAAAEGTGWRPAT
jgi:probable O-glycosylation ligase (exosortase A-associated)